MTINFKNFYIYVNPYMLIGEDNKSIVIDYIKNTYNIDNDDEINLDEFDMTTIPMEIFGSYNEQSYTDVVSGISYQQYTDSKKHKDIKVHVNTMVSGALIAPDRFEEFMKNTNNIKDKVFYLEIPFEKYNMDRGEPEIDKKHYEFTSKTLEDFTKRVSGVKSTKIN